MGRRFSFFFSAVSVSSSGAPWGFSRFPLFPDRSELLRFFAERTSEAPPPSRQLSPRPRSPSHRGYSRLATRDAVCSLTSHTRVPPYHISHISYICGHAHGAWYVPFILPLGTAGRVLVQGARACVTIFNFASYTVCNFLVTCGGLLLPIGVRVCSQVPGLLGPPEAATYRATAGAPRSQAMGDAACCCCCGSTAHVSGWFERRHRWHCCSREQSLQGARTGPAARLLLGAQPHNRQKALSCACCTCSRSASWRPRGPRRSPGRARDLCFQP